MNRTSVVKLGRNRGKPRIWIEGKYLESLGFSPGTKLLVEMGNGRVDVSVSPVGTKVVSSRRGKAIIDIENSRLAEALENAEKVQIESKAGKIVITPAKVEQARKSRKSDGTMGSIFSGGGLLDEAGKQAGYTSSFGLELDPDFADVWQANHKGHMFQGSIDEIPLARIPHVDLLVGGIPCEPFSHARRNTGNTKTTVKPEEHPLADLSIFALMVARSANPRNIVLEEAPAYAESPIGIVTMSALRRMGYTVESRLVDGTDYGSLSVRRRTVIVARTESGPIPWPQKVPQTRKLGELLLPPDDPRCEWWDRTTKPWFWEHREKHDERGNNFAAPILTPETIEVPAITKRYFNGQGGLSVVAHPNIPETFRWLTVHEVKSLMGLPSTYLLPDAKTVAGNIMGQGVLVDVFTRIILAVAPFAGSQVREAA